MPEQLSSVGPFVERYLAIWREVRSLMPKALAFADNYKRHESCQRRLQGSAGAPVAE